MKKCFKCGIEKPLSEFYRHKAMSDGYLNKCIACAKNDVALHRQKNIEKIRLYDRERGKLQHRIEKSKRVSYEWKAKHPKRRYAQNVLAAAVKLGKIKKLPCLICGEKSEAHHPDYDRPLDVVWLCSSHHKQAHALVKKENL